MKKDEERFNKNFTEDEKINIVKRLRKLNDVDEDSAEYKKSNQLIKYMLCDYKETIKGYTAESRKEATNKKISVN